MKDQDHKIPSLQTHQQKLKQNHQLLLMYKKLQQIEQSCWGKFFRFEKSQIFLAFQKRLTVYRTVRIRLDDVIYMGLLVLACLIFYFLPFGDGSHYLVGGYQHFLVYVMLFSGVWLASGHWFRHFFLFGVAVGFPVLSFLVYNGVVGMDPTDTSAAGSPLPESLQGFASIAALVPAYLTMYLIYPLKQFIRNKIGSLYSYLYALSLLILFIIWPMYSLIEQYIKNSTLTYTFITQNQALIITFIIILTFSFHLLVHNTFFQGNLRKTSQYLLYDFTKPQIQAALSQISSDDLQQVFIIRNYESYTRSMSAIVFAFTLLIEIYSFIYLSGNLEFIVDGVAVMVFAVAFLVYGCVVCSIGMPRSSVLYFTSLLSIIPACFSYYYYSLSFQRYVLLISVLPYSTIYWCIVRSLSHRRPFLKTNVTVLLYVLIHIPVTLYIVNSLSMLTTDTNTQQIINYIIIAILGIVCLGGIIAFIVWLRTTIRQLPKQDKQVDRQIDYNYHEEGNPSYIPYKKQQSFSLSWLASLDIRNISQLFSCIFYILSNLASFYILNQLLYTIDTSTLYSPDTISIIISQFVITFTYYTYTFLYIVLQIQSVGRVIYVVWMFVVGMVFIGLSYGLSVDVLVDYLFAFRLAGGVMIGVGFVAVALEVVKRRNQDIDKFLSGLISTLLWILVIIPYVIAIPIVSVYVTIQQFGMFIYYVILASTLLMILLVSFIASIFNLLLGKFQQQRKMKFLTEDVETFLKQQGINAENETLHVLYQSFQYRDKKYVYFLRRGFPIRLWKQRSSPTQMDIRTIVYNQEQLLKKESLSKIESVEESQDCCWRFLTCCCGVDEDEIKEKINKVREDQILDDQQMQQLVPNSLILAFLQGNHLQQPQQKTIDPSKIFSSKSIFLKQLTKRSRQLGEQWPLLQKKIDERTRDPQRWQSLSQSQKFKNKKLQIEIWHEIFQFVANNDDPPLKVVYNDFLEFCQIIQIPPQKISSKQIRQIYFQYATRPWKDITSLSMQQFSVVMEQISSQLYFNLENNLKQNERLSTFLRNNVYPMLCYYPQFRDAMNQRKVRTRNNYSQNRQNYQRETEQQLKQSPFMQSYDNYLRLSSSNKDKKRKFNQQRNKYQQTKLIEPNDDQYDKKRLKQQSLNNQKKEIKSKSCKLAIYEKYREMRACCGREEEESNVIKRKKVKPWEFLSVECVRIMEKKNSQWREKNQEEKIYQFKIILNNILIALFKLADLYTYLQITILNPKIGWQDYLTFSTLILQYRIQFYISLSLVVISVIIGLRGISFILEDRLGLTETRIPAAFPHPMFFFTTIYKLLILSLFNTQIMTLLSTFMCNWQSTTTPYYLILNENNTPLECFSFEHNIYLICAIIGIFAYYPLSAYTMPNFQFSEKTLDLKYKPTYLIIYFQVNFVLAAGKVLLAQITLPYLDTNTQASNIESIEIVFQSLNIACLLILAISVRVMQPCLIKWFNYIEMLVVMIGLIWNVMGLVLYLTDLWLVCLIVGGCLSAILIIFMIVFIKRRYFTNSQVAPQAQQQEIKQLQQIWKTRKSHNVNLIRLNQDYQQSDTTNNNNNKKDLLQEPNQSSLQYYQQQQTNKQKRISNLGSRKEKNDTEYNLRTQKSASKRVVDVLELDQDDSSDQNL